MAGSESISRVLIVDPRRLVRELLALALEQVPGVSARSVACDFDRLIAGISSEPPDVVILGQGCCASSLAHAVARVREASPTSALIVLSEGEPSDALLEAVEAGATSVVSLDCSTKELAARVRSAAAGDAVLPPEIAEKVLARILADASRPADRVPCRAADLTPREHEILALLTGGLANAEIARMVGLSANTVRNHLYSIYRKLGVRSRGQAFVEATRRGLVP